MHFERVAFIFNSRICPQLVEGKTVRIRNATQSARKLGLPALKLGLPAPVLLFNLDSICNLRFIFLGHSAEMMRSVRQVYATGGGAEIRGS